ncbi:MAG: PaaI family thioesterase [Methanomethylovorans sp.]|uniref:PaaI family thioesterase n=1 Tax=Methanomethylovorans sp. TaxID=2758717 RepID=UPI000A8E4E1E|nr:PaaI family thioesterase [Methanomethylovorans sp.]
MQRRIAPLMGLLSRDRFAAHCNIELLEVGPGYAKARMFIADEHLNAFGTVHGGAIFTLADLVFGSASNAHGRIAVAINCSIAFVKAARKGYLIAEAKEVSIGYKLATYIVTVTDEEDEVIATFQGTVYRKKEAIEGMVA